MEIFLARQAIYDRDNKSVAYELLHRSSSENKFDPEIHEDAATMKLISNSIAIGLDELINEKLAFVNFTNELILREIPSVLPKDKVVIEILENVLPVKKIIEAITNLKKLGYVFALDDVTINSEFWRFGKLIDIYKVDFRATSVKERKDIVQGIKALNEDAKLLAEKIETQEEYEEAIFFGYSYFQGYFFSKPLMMVGRDIPIRNVTCFSILSELYNADFDVNRIENIIKSDVSISYKIIKMLNSASFGFNEKISSIRQAIMLIGKEELTKWVTIIAMAEMQSGNEEEITKSLIVRARFCELVAEKIINEKKAQCFLVGLFSNLDQYMQKDMAQIVNEIPVEQELKDALLGQENIIYSILKLVKSYENMNEIDILEYSSIIGIDRGHLLELYLESINWQNTFGKVYHD